jgi:ferredoxin--NADP+ reductase
VDTVIFCIGDKVDDSFGLPVQWNAFVKNASPLCPVDEISYEVFDHEKKQPIPGIFVAGWSREASSGLVGVARKDGERGAKAILQYLAFLPPKAPAEIIFDDLRKRLQELGKPVVFKTDVLRLEAVEAEEAVRLGLEEFKFSSNEEMLAVMGLAEKT